MPGTVVSVPFLGVFRHKGIVSDRFHNGAPMVISNSPNAGGVTEEPWDVFASGNQVTVEGYPSNLPPCTVVQRARARIGSRYQLFNWNCEHLVLYAHGQQPATPQVAAVVTLAILFGLIKIARRT
jgi:hypothetical protein